MSSPQKQVTGRRLPPIAQASRKPHILHGRRKLQSINQNIPPSPSESQTSFRRTFSQQSLKSTGKESPPKKLNRYDTGMFLEDLSMLDPQIIFEFLRKSPDLMETFINDYISREELETWLAMKSFEKFQERISVMSLEGCGMPPSAKWKNTSSLERQHFMESFISEIHTFNGDVRGHVLHQLTDCCAAAVNASGFSLYMVDNESNLLWQFVPESTKAVNTQTIKEGTTLSCYVAATRETVLCTDLSTPDDRFPMGTGEKETCQGSALCLPIIQTTGELTGVMELMRASKMTPFSEKDNQISSGYLAWGGVVLHYAEMYHAMRKQRKLNEFLLNVTKSIFQDIISMDTVIMKIMNFAQTLVDADRTSLFLVDNNTNELYARIFDIGTGLETKLQQEIRFPKSKGVAGHVATTGETLNIKNAYDDPRFNRDIDIQTGYKTHTLLCMPIFIRGNLIGVVQMVNKKHGVFTSADEKAFQTFAIYCGLALHHAKLYDKIRRSEQKYKVALEVLSYHSMCTESEIQTVQNINLKQSKESIERFDFNVLDVDAMEMARIAIDMFENVFGTEHRFNRNEITRFTLTVRKNYRRVPYHNWAHAFTVAHCMFCILKYSGGVVSSLEAIALYVACLCHDLDHRGKNNEWMKTESTPLAAVYTTSTLEHHHFNQTITILQHEGHNIFSQLNSNDYKLVLGMIKECILSTDLASFFGNKAKLQAAVTNNQFSWKETDYRKMFRALAMTASDLSACAKPWQVQYETVKVIFQEFYAQGDEEKALGRTPVPMMDRNTADKLPNHQVGFLVGICIPGYNLLQQLIPGAKPLLDGAKKNLSVWSEMVKKQNEEKEKLKEKEEQSTEQRATEKQTAKESPKPPATEKDNSNPRRSESKQEKSSRKVSSSSAASTKST